jgi:hypothetical protein
LLGGVAVDAAALVMGADVASIYVCAGVTSWRLGMGQPLALFTPRLLGYQECAQQLPRAIAAGHKLVKDAARF